MIETKIEVVKQREPPSKVDSQSLEIGPKTDCSSSTSSKCSTSSIALVVNDDSEDGTEPEIDANNGTMNTATKGKIDRHVGVFDGVRVISALIVMFHHIPALDEDLTTGYSRRLIVSSSNSISSGSMGGIGERYLGLNDELDYHNEDGSVNFVKWLILVGPGNIAVEVFLLLSGFVAAYPVYMSKCLSRYEKLLFKRFFRLGLPLIPVHIVSVILWSKGISYGNYYTFPSKEVVRDSYNIGIAFIFASELNGALWIVKEFFIAPFFALGMQLPVIQLNFTARAIWYAFCLAYLLGNLVNLDTISPYLSVALGVILADVHSEYDLCKQYIGWKMRIISLFLVFLPWFPPPFYANRLCMALSGFGFVFLALYFKPLTCIFGNKAMKYCSKYTYEMYIWHLVVYNVFGASVIPNVEGNSKYGYFILAFTVSILVAIVAFWIFELPSMLITSKLTNHLFSMVRD